MKRCVLVGYPLDHSLSPLMQSAAFKATGLSHKFEYRAWPLRSEKLSWLINAMKHGEIHGANVTMPHKSKILEHSLTLSHSAISVGCVNTLFLDDNQVVGCNTDLSGFIKAIEESGITIKGQRATVIGSGGAARAVLVGLARLGVQKVTVFNRSRTKAKELTKQMGNEYEARFCSHGLRNIMEKLGESMLLVNCTPIGMRGHAINQTPIPSTLLAEIPVVMDLVYNPIHTRLLREARDAGCRTISGERMLVYQGAASFEIWTGKKAPVEVMHKTVLGALKGADEE